MKAEEDAGVSRKFKPLLLFWGAGEGGDAAVSIAFAAALKRMGVNAPLVAYAYGHPDIFRQKAEGAGLDMGEELFLISEPERLWEETGLARSDFNILHVHHGRTVPKRTDIVPLKRIAGRLPLVLTAHGPLPLESIAYGGLKSKLSRIVSPLWFDAIVVPSEAKAREWRRMTPLAGKVTAIHNIVSFLPRMDKTQARARLSIAEDDKIVLYCSRLDPDKDPLTFARAIAEAAAKTPRLRALMVGSGELAQECRKLITDLSAPIDLVGYVPDPAPYYCAADVFVQPSLYESFGITLLHAVDLGLQCVAADLEVFRDLYFDCETISWFSPGDASECAAAICDALESPKRNPPTIDYRERFSSEASMEAYLRLWRRVLEKKWANTLL